MKYLTIIPKEIDKWYGTKNKIKKFESTYTSKLIFESPIKSPWNKEIIIIPIIYEGIIYLKGRKPKIEDLDNKKYLLTVEEYQNQTIHLIAKENEFHAIIPLYNKHYLQVKIIEK